ncbi:hypothetical protein QOZ80_5BG0454310 [Eleusine coracana subsp. coracana]|nr:hypothetical protein QOZ80_5BG0454310 [Eleusine coracana subsp. coracana]
MNAPVASMGGLSRLDLLKRAMKFIISKLDDTDRLAVVAFNDQVVEEYSTNLMHISESRCKAKRKVDELTAGGKTAFKPGLERAVKILEERGGDDMANRAGFILLVSDGMERSDKQIQWSRHESTTTSGNNKKRSRTILLRKYPVHTFGLGAGHDPRALHLIAHDSRGGTYSFVNDDDDDGGSSIAAALAVCLAGLKSVVTADARVKLTTTTPGGVRIRGVESGGFRSRVAGDGTQGEVVVDAMYAGEVKSFVVRLRLPAVSDDHHHQQQQQLLVVSAVEAGGGSSSVVVSIHRPPAQTVDWATSASGLRVHTPSPTVVNQIVRFELLKMVARFLREEEEGELLLLEDAAADDSLGRRLQSKWEEFKEAHKFWAGLDMAGLDREMGQLRRHGVAYVYSWASSHHMQRATTMGSPEKVVAEFLTAEMRALRAEAREEEAVVEEEEEEEERVTSRRRIIPEERRRPSSCGRFERIDRRLEMWAKLKSEVPLLFREEEKERQSSRETATDNFFFDNYPPKFQFASFILGRRYWRSGSALAECKQTTTEGTA